MPSVRDVANQVNAKLDTISSNTTNTAQHTAETVEAVHEVNNTLQATNNRLQQINATLESGFTNLAGGLFAILQVNLAQLAMLNHHREQNNTMICEMSHANEQLCKIVRKLARQLQLEEGELEAVRRVEGIFERVHAEAVSDYDRDQALHAKIETCCPPEKPRPEPCPEPCARPEFRAPKPEGVNWKPFRQPDNQVPEG